MLRKAHCKSSWYPRQREQILPYLSSLPKKNLQEISSRISFGFCPHAGWDFSGKTAGAVYGALGPLDTVFILATNHSGLGEPSSLFTDGTWEMPLGNVSVNREAADILLQFSRSLKTDVEAHLFEHAIEVQIPFLQAVNPEIQIVPIEMMDYRLETCRDIARAVAETVQQMSKKNPGSRIGIIASSDMTHCGALYGQSLPKNMSAMQFAESQDKIAIEQLLSLNAEKLLETVKENRITMCGPGPAAAVMEASRHLGATRGTMLQYSTSAEVMGERSDIAVGYAGILFH